MQYSGKSADKDRTQTSEHIEDVVTSLRVIARSLGAIALRLSHTRPKNDSERIDLLTGLGFDAKEIATILDTTVGTVKVRRSNSAKRLKSKSKKGVSATGNKAKVKPRG